MQAQPKTIREILYAGEQYVIPLFQRYYSWKKENWERLRLDVWALIENGSKPVHFLGPLVCHLPSKMPGNTTSFQLIDGQQRITTLTILLSAIRDVARSRGLNELAEEITEDYLLFKRKQGIERYKILPRLGDREVLTAMIEGHDMTPFAGSGVFEAWKYFQRHVQHLSRKDTENQLRRLLTVISTRLNLVVVVIDGENPYEIFDSLNSTGLPLEESDLIRNFVFMDMPAARQQAFDDQHWKPFEQLFAATETEAAVDMTAFYRDYLMREGRYSKEDATFVDFKATHEEGIKQPETLVATLRRYARLDLMLRRPGSVGDRALRSLLRQVDGMDISTAFPLLLNLLDRHEKGSLSPEDLHACLSDLISFVLRRSICGESTRAYGRWFVEAITMIRDNPAADLQAYWLGRRWPDDATVRQRLPGFELYRRESTKTRAVLERLEESFGHHEKVDLSTLTIEHVMPQTITNNKNGRAWKEMLGEEWETIQGELLHTIGNLTLTGYNIELSNSPFETKRAELAQSHIDLNLHFANLQKWDASAIRARGAALTEQVIALWPRPQTGVAYAASAEAMPEPSGLSTAAKARLDYWRHLDARLEDRGLARDLITPTPDSSLSIGIGTTGSAEFALSFNQSKREIYVTLALAGKAGESIGRGLEKAKDVIHAELQYSLKWDLEGGSMDIYVTDDGIQTRDQNDWPIQHDWFGDRLEDFQRVLQPRVLALEKEALLDPGIKRELDQQQMRRDYWNACTAVVNGPQLQAREGDRANGRAYCRLAHLDDGIRLGVQLGAANDYLSVYLGVTSTASPHHRRLFKQMLENQLAELSSLVGQELDKSETYLWIALDADVTSRNDWPRQHLWIKESAGKFLEIFKPRLEID
jgi:hypothetical protein